MDEACEIRKLNDASRANEMSFVRTAVIRLDSGTGQGRLLMILKKLSLAIAGVMAVALAPQSSLAQAPSSRQPSAGSEKTVPPAPQANPSASTEKVTDAERISRLQRSIDETQKQLDEMRVKVNDPQSEYKKAETEFSDLDRQYEEGRKNLQKTKDEGGSGKVAPLESELSDLEKRRTLARERFDLAIKERKGLQGQITTLEQKLVQDQDALNKLLGVQSPKPVAPTAADTAGAQPVAPGTAAPSQPGTQSPSDTGSQDRSTSSAPPGTQPAQGQAVPLPTPNSGSPGTTLDVGTQPATVQPITTAPPPTNGQPAADAINPPTSGPKSTSSEKLVKAQEEATTKQAAAEEAKQEAQSATDRLESIRKAIANERDLLKTARQKAKNARESLRTQNEEWEKRLGAGETWAQTKDLRLKIADAEQRVGEAETEIRERSERIDTRQSELANLQSERVTALQEAESKVKVAEAAQRRVEQLENPFTPQNILQWLIDHGPRIVFTLVGTILLLWLSKVMEHRLVRLLVRHGTSGSSEDRENRARTLVSVVRNGTTVLLVAGASLSIIAEFGVNIYPLVGAAGVVGLAVAFGAQNLIRDYFTGFMILMENQYTVNDVVKIGEIAGQVESISLRMTVLRDLRGTVHFVPHGQINVVSNLTHGWSRALFDIGIAYKEDVDRVMKVLMDLGKEIRRDPVYRDLILDEPEMLGVDSFGDSAVVIRFLIKTRPLKQWTVKRELNRRIKKKFDEMKIEIPFPQRTVYHRYEADGDRRLARGDDTVEWGEPHSAKR